MKTNSAILLLLLMSGRLFSDAQVLQHKPENFVNFSTAGQYYFNRSYIVSDGKSPNPLGATNTQGYNIELAYQHTTRWRFLITYGVQYGVQPHDVYLNYDLAQFDPESIALSTMRFSHHYDLNFRFFNQRLMLGYVHPLPQEKFKSWAAEIKAGFGTKVFSYAMVESGNFDVSYPSNDSGIVYIHSFANIKSNLGNANGYTDRWNINSSKNTFLQTFECYLGVRKDINIGHARNFFIGLEFTKAAYPNESINNFVRLASYDKDLNIVSEDWYYNKNLSLGLRLGVGFW